LLWYQVYFRDLSIIADALSFNFLLRLRILFLFWQTLQRFSHKTILSKEVVPFLSQTPSFRTVYFFLNLWKILLGKVIFLSFH